MRAVAHARPPSGLLAGDCYFQPSPPPSLEPRSHPRVLRVANAPARDRPRDALFFLLHSSRLSRDCTRGRTRRRHPATARPPRREWIPSSRCVHEKLLIPIASGPLLVRRAYTLGQHTCLRRSITSVCNLR